VWLCAIAIAGEYASQHFALLTAPLDTVQLAA
jgi:hypothetical protein